MICYGNNFLQWSINVIQCTCNLRDLKRLYSQTRVILFCWLLKINPFLFILKNSTMSHKSNKFMLAGASSLSSQSAGLKFNLTASWICSWQNKVQLLIHPCKQAANCFVSGQLPGILNLFIFISIFCFCPYLWVTLKTTGLPVIVLSFLYIEFFCIFLHRYKM